MPSAKKVPAQIWYFVKTNKTIEQNKKTGTYPEDMA
jgi:ribosomal protein L39E